MTENQPFHFVIAGGGSAGWMAAAALSRFAPPGSHVTLVESAEIGTIGVGEATIPQIHNFNRALGIDEAVFLRETAASFKLGIEFDGWRVPGESYMHAFGLIGRQIGLVPFHHYWIRARQLGLAGPTAAYSPNETAARALRMPHPAHNAAQMPYAYHFDAGLYAAMLRRIAEGAGTTRIEGTIAQVERDGARGGIRALVLEDGRRIAGDFFVDCTGFRALLIGSEDGNDFEDWGHWLPCDRAIAVPCASGGDFTPYTRSTAHRSGWQWRIPLQHRIGNGIVYSSAWMDEDEARAILLANLDGEPTAEPRPIRFTTGKRRRHWSGNCLALGLAAGFLEPLESTSLHLIQSAISRFLSVLPRGEHRPAVVSWFNEQADIEWSRIRDFIILHYHANERVGEPFWDAMRERAIPDTLAARISQWREGGLISRMQDELFTEPAWFQVLAGQGVAAEGYNPIADSLDTATLRTELDKLARGVKTLADGLPGHQDTLRALVAPAPIQGMTA